MNILGISAGFHDAGVSIVRDGEILYASHTERYSKKKHDKDLDSKMFGELLLEYGEADVIAYYEKPWLKKLRQLYSGQYSDVFSGSIKNMVSRAYGMKIPKIDTWGHHKSHAAAGFQTSTFEDATVVVIDAIGEWDTTSIWHAEYDRNGYATYTKLWSQRYPHSIGLFYSAMTQRAGLKPLDEEYILMGMAAYAVPDFKVLKNFVGDKKEIKFKDNLHLGCEDYRPDLNEFQIASSAQTVLESLIHSVMSRARILGTSKNLVYMGGVALNCSANEHIGAYYDNIWIMPNPGDAGSSLGAAALTYGKKLNWSHPYLGKNIPGSYPVKDALSELLTNQMVGVASGRAEFGPRALGNRSLLADPRGQDIKDRVNEIKRRQKFRPFAPAILEEYVDEYFEMPTGFKTSPYMQVVAHCRHPNEFPAIVHFDGTSRVQTVAKDSGTGLRDLLEAWHNWTGCPMLLNTSLNIRGEPMVNDRSDADRFEREYGVRVVS